MSQESSAIAWSDEQSMLLDIAARFMKDKWPIENVREHLAAEPGYDLAVWQDMRDAGWCGLAIPEDYGGDGFSLSDLVPIVERMGRALLASPFVPTQIAAQALLEVEASDEPAGWLAQIAGGATATVAFVGPGGDWNLLAPEGAEATVSGDAVELAGTRCLVQDLAVADYVVASVLAEGEPALALFTKADLGESRRQRETVIDETRCCYRLDLDGLEIPRGRLVVGEEAERALLAARDAALLLYSAEACGGIAGVLDVVLEYLKSRQQFGRLIGGYQALKHPTVDILTGLERARSHLYHAATVFGTSRAEVALRMAKAEASDSFVFAGDRAIQFHGGFGFTYACDAQLFLRRAMWSQFQFGDAQHHRKHLAGLVL